MNKESAIKTIEDFRLQMHQKIDANCDSIIERIKNGESLDNHENCIESVIPLSAMSALFKGKKITAVSFTDGGEIKVSKWKDAVKLILQDCNSDEKMHNTLVDICGKVYGRNRVLFSKSPADMIAPIKIDEDMYFETKFDIESMLNVLKNRILDFVGYDYSKISVKVAEPNINMNQINEDDTEETVGLIMSGM